VHKNEKDLENEKVSERELERLDVASSSLSYHM